MVRYAHRLKRYLAAALLVLGGSSTMCLAAPELNVGIAVITSLKGETSFIDSATNAIELELHKSLQISEQTLTTSNKSHVFFVFSNGLGLGMDADSVVHIKDYSQTPFLPKRANLDYEPSTSELHLELRSGAINIASQGLSPRSQIRVHTENGTLRTHSANCHIQQDETGTTIVTFEGNATFYYPDGEKREFIARSSAIRISSQSAKLGNIAEIIDFKTVEESKRAFSAAAYHASNRVFFTAPEGQPWATPVLIAPRDHLDQAPVRPYEYNE